MTFASNFWKSATMGQLLLPRSWRLCNRTTAMLWCSAAIGGALPTRETLATLQAPLRKVRGIIDGTFAVVLDAWAQAERVTTPWPWLKREIELETEEVISLRAQGAGR
jgi:hypothetical protein